MRMTPDRLAVLRAMGEGQRLRCSAINAMGLPGEHYPVTIPHRELLYLLDCAVFALAVAGDDRDN